MQCRAHAAQQQRHTSGVHPSRRSLLCRPHVSSRLSATAGSATTTTTQQETLPTHLPLPGQAMARPGVIRVFSYADDPQGSDICSTTVGRAFASDPGNIAFSADGHPDYPMLRWHAISNNIACSNAQVPLIYSTAAHQAVAYAWLYPEESAESPPEEDTRGWLTLGLVPFDPAWSRPEAGPARDSLLEYLGSRKKQFLEERGPFLYVCLVCVAPELQGKGLGAHLLRALTQRADAMGRYMYLEATTEANRRLYARHGFVDVEHKVWTAEGMPGKVELFVMERPPASGAAGAKL